MFKVEHSVLINRPIEEIFSYVTNPENEVKWQGQLVEARLTSEGPMSVGTTGVEVRKIMGGIRMETAWECTEFETNRAMSFKSTSGPMPIAGGYTFGRRDYGTKVSLTLEGRPK